jgi:hypothetical protein
MATINHGFTNPPYRDEQWHKPLDNNRAEYDRKIEIRDVASNLGNYTPRDGALFHATDNGRKWVGDGTQWLRLVEDFSDTDLNPATITPGDSDSVDAIVGTSGEYEYLTSMSFGPTATQETSTGYTNVLSGEDKIGVPASLNAPTNATNLYVAFSAVLNHASAGETAYARVRDVTHGNTLTGTEITAAGTTRQAVYSTPVAYDPGDDWEATIQMKSSTNGSAAELVCTPDFHLLGGIQ